ncbi:MAG: ATP-binding protein [Desulfobacteraceae bacterium]
MDQTTALKKKIQDLNTEIQALKHDNFISKNLINAVDDPFFLINGRGIILEANFQARKKYAFGQADIKKICIWDRLLPDTARDWQTEITKVIQKNRPGRFQFDDCDHVRELIIWPAYNKNGQITFFALLEKDITQNIRALENLNLFNTKKTCTDDQMRHASKMINLGTLISGITHEINNPNSFVLTNGPLLEQIWTDLIDNIEDYLYDNQITAGGLDPGDLTAVIPSLLKGISEGALRIDRIVKSLKSFSRPDTREAFEPVSLNDIIKNSLLFINSEIAKATKNFNVCLDTQLPLIAGIQQRLGQIVINLLLNACQALTSHEQAIEISTYTQNQKVCLQVKDQGAGIEEENIDKICDPFFTTRTDIQPSGSGGTGLGLAITHKIVKEHSAGIEFDSDPGRGTCVTVTFPAMDIKKTTDTADTTGTADTANTADTADTADTANTTYITDITDTTDKRTIRDKRDTGGDAENAGDAGDAGSEKGIKGVRGLRCITDGKDRT